MVESNKRKNTLLLKFVEKKKKPVKKQLAVGAVSDAQKKQPHGNKKIHFN